MPKNPFAPHDGPAHPIKRNAFDMSHQRLTTSDFGKLMPILCQEVIPGDSFRIDSSVALRAMPTAFPLQTRCRLSTSFFYVRNRTLWKDFEDFIFKTKDNLTPPFLQLNNSRAKTMVSTGSLGDNLCSIPSTVGTTTSIGAEFSFSSFMFSPLRESVEVEGRSISSWVSMILNPSNFVDSFSIYSNHNSSGDNKCSYSYCESSAIRFGLPLSSFFTFPLVNIPEGLTTGYSDSDYFLTINVGRGQSHRSVYAESCSLNIDPGNSLCRFALSDNFINRLNGYVSQYGEVYISIVLVRFAVSGAFSTSNSSYNNFRLIFAFSGGTAFGFDNAVQSYTSPVPSILDSTDDSFISSNPFVGNSPLLPINALPFRAYEMICNYYFRNDLNNPYVLNGQVQYNKFIPTTDGGADTNIYDYHFHNWELDMFTSALQSPQFGTAPLVGLTFSGTNTADFTFEGDNGSEYHATVGVEDDKIVNIVDFDKEIPSGNLRQLMQMVSYGISINDLRNVNSFQRFLENCMRKGLRYRNQLKSHLGVSVDYPDIDVPQYIGGFSSYLNSGQNTNLADSPEAGLGDFNGSLGGSAQSSHSINCYCPEHGFIIGITSIVPAPIYSQSMPKFNLKSDAFDYFQSEFSKTGFVPVHYSEVCPLQNLGVGQSPSDIFGYQRAWYDYMSNLDSTHGDFRTTLQQFTLSRTFEQRPTLVNDFVRVYPDQLNDIFVTNNIADRYGSNAKFLLNVYHHITALRPIPRNGVPALE